MDMGIAGKWALVCGASKGLGYGCADALVREGVHVVLVARGTEALEDAAARLRAHGTQVLAVAADITSEEGRAKVFATRRDYDILVTNAGGPPPGDFHDWGREEWIKALDANMLTPIELIKAVVDGMVQRRFGRIVNITSAAVKSPMSHLGLSNGARSGLTGFLAGIARSDIAGANVTINNLLPGPFDTDRLRSTVGGLAKKSGRPLEEVMAERRGAVPAKRFGTVEEFGAACAFLCSVHASYIVGQNVLLDGGSFPGTF